ncbi:unnamed protein product (macronuclear) [Paramecium tetraurelia]|uniref:Uncharacterized protein n=1 Tax=Paramecium tetraurelia TaxID=5888 RepID=A0DPU3_PARTE|nr:uncharacterized protein GSPATT00039711001 [Paramecium tetraurelia]CAK85060.1 unnamed protein product [Paramecium tetraurelia]|eukprot:XP_001452457.1 hypothetical protein (macronuclear) [Paramecium tetraurelia strain d4-2]
MNYFKKVLSGSNVLCIQIVQIFSIYTSKQYRRMHFEQVINTRHPQTNTCQISTIKTVITRFTKVINIGSKYNLKLNSYIVFLSYYDYSIVDKISFSGEGNNTSPQEALVYQVKSGSQHLVHAEKNYDYHVMQVLYVVQELNTEAIKTCQIQQLKSIYKIMSLILKHSYGCHIIQKMTPNKNNFILVQQEIVVSLAEP